MGVIDADTHVDETEDTWEWLTEAEDLYRPTTGYPPNPDPTRRPTRYWMIDGHRQPRQYRDDQRTGTTAPTRELHDPQARLRHMDELGTEIQVLYPSLFLVGITETSAVDVALKRSYNRWLADRCQNTGGRLRWICLPPLTDIKTAVEEIRFAKANGACGILKKGDREAGHWVNDEYFFPIYEECQRLDLPVCFHIGSGTPDFTSAQQFVSGRFIKIGLPPVHAFHSLVQFGIPAKFPGVRWGFVEAGSSWVPFAVYDLIRRTSVFKPGENREGYTYNSPADIVRLNKLYITCQVDEDLSYILRYTGEDHLLCGSDYGHSDGSQETAFVRMLRKRAELGDIPESAVGRITEANPRTFYGL